MIAFYCNNHESLLIMCCSHANDAQGKHSKLFFFKFLFIDTVEKVVPLTLIVLIWLKSIWNPKNMTDNEKVWSSVTILLLLLTGAA